MRDAMFGETGLCGEDAELVDERGLPVPVPDHSEAELAAILATDPMNDPVFAAGFAARDVGPDGLPGRVVPAAEWLSEDVQVLGPGTALAGSLARLTGVEPPSGLPAAGIDATDGDASGLEELEAGELRRVVAGWERVVSWARAAQARVARELMARTDGVLERDSVAGEVSAELHVTAGEGWQVAARGEGLGRYPLLGADLAGGRVDAKKADTFLRAGVGLTPAERGEAIEDLLPAARTRTWRWVSEQLNARAVRLHGRRARRGDVIDRCGVWAEQAGPGTGRIVADLPVVEAARTFNTVQAAARALKDVPGENRPLGALRAAAFTALVTGDLVLPCEDTAESDDHVDPVDPVGRGAGVHVSLLEPPRLVEPVLDTDLIPVPDDPHGPALTRPAPTGTRLRVIEVPSTVHVTVPATVLLDPDEHVPGILDGIGPIPADAAARVAADGTWRRLLTDPATGVLTDYSTRTYSPGAVLRAAVTTRDRSCRFPGCDRPASSGGSANLDLDHIDPFDHDNRHRPGRPGQTRATNLHPLCRKHHNLKTHASWQVTRDPGTGATRWTAPTGTSTVVDPAVVDPTVRYAHTRGMTLARRPGPPAAEASTPGTPPGTGPPPF
ncbi:hypothetical protein GCM10028784_19040 [Myceligenerans cantabricum]